MMIDKDGYGSIESNNNNNNNNNNYCCKSTTDGRPAESRDACQDRPINSMLTSPGESIQLMNESNSKVDSRKGRTRRRRHRWLRPASRSSQARILARRAHLGGLLALDRSAESSVKAIKMYLFCSCLLLALSGLRSSEASLETGGNDGQDYARIPTSSPELTDGQRQAGELAPMPAGPTGAPAANGGAAKESSGRRGAANKQRSSAPILRVSESELLPFADFNVQQPAFSDLMKTWPPTTLNERNEQHRISQQRQQSRPAGIRLAGGSLAIHAHQPAALDEPRNHLNEDLDDTILTADQAFERDQAQEPPTHINYLGDLGDYLYSQLRQAQNESAELLDELLDDFYYQHYQNSHTLYYGAQLVREGDIFEIGCYLPAEQAAEWTKSGRPLAADRAAGSPRVVRRTDYLGAKQNFTLKVFEASLVSS